MWKKICLTSILCILAYGFLVEPNRLKIRNVTINNGPMAKLLSEKKIALLSDLHIGNSQKNIYRKTLQALKKLDPDLIFLTGDFVQWYGNQEAYQNTRNFLDELKASMGVYAVMGESDYSTSKFSCLYCHGSEKETRSQGNRIHFLRNSSAIISTPTGDVAIIGLDSYADEMHETPLLEKLPADRPCIILSHSSLPFSSIKKKDILLLAGDTHGGQIRLPQFIWNVIQWKPDSAHMYGLYQERGNTLYVTSGIGTSHLNIRLGMNPEIVLLHFTK
jgi:predicted MPP superfamily phosphohydrolase